MITHVKCKKVDEVDKFLNKAGLKPNEVQITYVATGFQSYYMIFYEDPTLTPKKKSKSKAKAETEPTATPVEQV